MAITSGMLKRAKALANWCLLARSKTLSWPSGTCIQQQWAKKWCHKLMAIMLPNLNRFTIFVIGRFLGKFAVNRLLKILPLIAYVATIPCETLNKRLTINYNVYSVATYLSCGGVVNNQIKKGLLISLSAIFLNRWIFGKVTSKNVVVSCTLRAWPTHCWKTKKVHETNRFFLVSLPYIYRFKKYHWSETMGDCGKASCSSQAWSEQWKWRWLQARTWLSRALFSSLSSIVATDQAREVCQSHWRPTGNVGRPSKTQPRVWAVSVGRQCRPVCLGLCRVTGSVLSQTGSSVIQS